MQSGDRADKTQRDEQYKTPFPVIGSVGNSQITWFERKFQIQAHFHTGPYFICFSPVGNQ